jgi:hypothetical protein
MSLQDLRSEIEELIGDAADLYNIEERYRNRFHKELLDQLPGGRLKGLRKLFPEIIFLNRFIIFPPIPPPNEAVPLLTLRSELEELIRTGSNLSNMASHYAERFHKNLDDQFQGN